jgi:hypothetical protein
LTSGLPDPIRVALRLGDELDALGVRYMVGGSVASSIHGEPRATDDVDIVAGLSAEHVTPLLDRLKADFFVQGAAVREAVETHSSFNVIFLASMMKADMFVPRDDFQRQALGKSTPVVIDPDSGASLFVPAAEDVVLQKLVWYREAGGTSEPWRDVLGVLKVQGTRLDLRRLGSWAQELQIAELLSRALEVAGIPTP